MMLLLTLISCSTSKKNPLSCPHFSLEINDLTKGLVP